jgi:hypothetical protein
VGAHPCTLETRIASERAAATTTTAVTSTRRRERGMTSRRLEHRETNDCACFGTKIRDPLSASGSPSLYSFVRGFDLEPCAPKATRTVTQPRTDASPHVLRFASTQDSIRHHRETSDCACFGTKIRDPLSASGSPSLYSFVRTPHRRLPSRAQICFNARLDPRHGRP